MTPLEARFWAKVDRRRPDDCWLWQGAIDRRGYGRFSFLGRNAHAHQVALLIDGRPLPKGAYACHHCDVKACVNPRHLYVGTARTNVLDMYARGRAALNPRRGEASAMSRLTEAAVQAIRSRYAAGDVNQRELAAEYGVTQPTIWRVVHQETWAHVA